MSWFKQIPWLSLSILVVTYGLCGWIYASWAVNLIDQGKLFDWVLDQTILTILLYSLGTCGVLLIALVFTAPIALMNLTIGKWIKSDSGAFISIILGAMAFALVVQALSLFAKFFVLLASAMLFRLDLRAVGLNTWISLPKYKQRPPQDVHLRLVLVELVLLVTYMSDRGKSTGRTVKPQAEGFIWQKLIEVNQIECGSVAMIRRSCFDRVGLFDRALRSYVEDWDMWLRLSLHFQFKVIPQSLVYYRQRPNSASRNLTAMEQSFQLVLQKATAAAPPELQPFMSRGYGFAYFCLAWKALQSLEPDYKIAKQFQKIALNRHPQRFFSKENLRLTIAIALMQWFGQDGYLKFIELMHSLRRKLSTIGYQTSTTISP